MASDDEAFSRIAFGLAADGWEINIVQHLDRNAAGRTHYAERRIEILSQPVGLAVIALAHEAGHVLHFNRCPDGLTDNSMGPRAEEKAYLYGWAVLAAIGHCPPKGFWRWIHNREATND